ncbi:MAG: endonuclease/exonuclease/phosphatase family protein [Burkholderiaceae bacterium]|jgi:endonuclease/exonuclease/phosphatase family metal-dependent hydrolase|nr:endonuclease/exonuclease/phosphatase family protein [Burkholderiaceae bacterium]MDP4969222.1 endonuclease/exonuclease/phosphatase family protein [Burkholderiaceae bacterium]MDP5111214.1 endonuclease/exonuclease/phosphatase family protein [Burkholderiaceae bacterium]
MKILTWNVQWFKGLDGVVDIERVLHKAREMADFDVLCMQEISVNYHALTGETPADQVARVRELLPDYEVFFAPAIDELSPCGTYRQQFGNLIASRLPVRLVEHILLPDPAAEGEKNTPSMRRVCVVCTVEAPWGPVRVMTSHLEYYNATARVAQVSALREIHLRACARAARPPETIQDSPYQRKPYTMDAVLCGDFNFELDSAEHATMIQPDLLGALINAWTTLDSSKSYPATFRIFDRTYGPEPVGCDFFFVSPSMAKRVQVVSVDQQTQVSDHQPVLLELSDVIGA